MYPAITDITPFSKRGTGYCIFNTNYGLALLAGAALMGLLHDMNQTGIIIALTCAADRTDFSIFLINFPKTVIDCSL